VIVYLTFVFFIDAIIHTCMLIVCLVNQPNTCNDVYIRSVLFYWLISFVVSESLYCKRHVWSLYWFPHEELHLGN